MSNDTIVITGGSSGIGKALAKLFLQDKNKVIIIGRRLDLINQTVNELKSISEQIYGYALNVVNEEEIKAFVKYLDSSTTKLDVLINSAGVSTCKEFEKTTLEENRSIIDTNYSGLVNMTYLLLPLIKKSNYGRIINISSIAGLMGLYGSSAYAPSKFAVIGFTDVLRNELSKNGIHVSLVLPPDTDTPMMTKSNTTRPLVNKKISGNVKLLSADTVATKIYKAIQKNKYLIIPSSSGKIVYHLNRLFPNLLYKYTQGIIKNGKF